MGFHLTFKGLRKLHVYSMKQLHVMTLRGKIYLVDADWKRVTLMPHKWF
jgi:hypothetical protein